MPLATESRGVRQDNGHVKAKADRQPDSYSERDSWPGGDRDIEAKRHGETNHSRGDTKRTRHKETDGQCVTIRCAVRQRNKNREKRRRPDDREQGRRQWKTERRRQRGG